MKNATIDTRHESEIHTQYGDDRPRMRGFLSVGKCNLIIELVNEITDISSAHFLHYCQRHTSKRREKLHDKKSTIDTRNESETHTQYGDDRPPVACVNRSSYCEIHQF